MFVVFALIATIPLVALSYLAVAETRNALTDEVGRSHEDTAREALRAGAGHREFTDPLKSEPSLAGYAPAPGLGWAVVDEVPTSVAYAPLTRLTAVFIVLSGILVGAILLASVVLARRIVQPVR